MSTGDKATPEICGRCFSGSYCAECMAMHKGTVACMEALKGFNNGNELVRMHEDDEAREEAMRLDAESELRELCRGTLAQLPKEKPSSSGGKAKKPKLQVRCGEDLKSVEDATSGLEEVH